MTQRFMSIIEHPGHMRTDHLVIDLERCVVVAKCSSEKDADTIAAVLNIQAETRQSGLLLEEQV